MSHKNTNLQVLGTLVALTLFSAVAVAASALYVRASIFPTIAIVTAEAAR